jgi:subtilisin family serine protease
MRNAYVYQSTGYYGSFENYGYSWATAGNTDVTISDIASTKKTIAVGAYASKTVFTNTNGQSVNYSGYVQKLRLVPFSSRGPATDGRVKPDITAPGLLLISAVNSYDTSFIPGGSSYGMAAQSFIFNGRTYVYAGLMGTSMSSPSVSGIVGMMLQANPKLTPDDVKNIIFETAIEDAYTGNLPTAGNNSWGHGKINAYGAVKRTWETNSVKEIVSTAGGFSLFPNPGIGSYVIDYTATKNETAIVRVYDVKGSLVSAGNWQLQPGLNTYSLSLSGKAKGIYFTQLTKAGKVYTIKTVLQ